jgi:hypothetical protein
MSHETGLRIVVDWQSLGVDDLGVLQANISLNGCRLRDAIGALIPTAEVFSAPDGIHVVKPGAAPTGVRAYPIGDLAAKLGFDADDQLVRLIESHVRSDDWADNGGKFEISTRGNFLLVCETFEGHEEIERLLDMLRKEMIGPANSVAPTRLDHEFALRTKANSILRRRISELRFSQTPLESALASLQADAHFGAIIRWDQLEAAGISSASPVTLDVSGLPLEKALDLLCETMGITYNFHNEIVEITLPDQAGRIVESRVFNAHEFIDVMTGFAGSHVPRGNQLNRQEALHYFRDLVESTIEPDSWKDNGGSVASLGVIGACLVVKNTARVNESISSFMAEVQAASQPATQPTPAVSKTIDPLTTKLGDMVFDSTPLECAIDMLAERSGTKILVDWKALEGVGIERDTPITARVYDTSLRRGLAVVLDLAGINDAALACRADETGIVHVSSAEMIGRNGVIHVYNIRDLIERYVSYRHVDGRPRPADQETAQQDAIDSITKMIEDTIDTDSWRDNGGSIGSLREFAGLLIVSNTTEAHQKIKAFLERLRLQPDIDNNTK